MKLIVRITLYGISLILLAIWGFGGQALKWKTTTGITVHLAFAHSVCNSILGAYAQSLNYQVAANCNTINNDYLGLEAAGILALLLTAGTTAWIFVDRKIWTG